jgi:O-antigen/teichoic acid export membrane protein
LSLAKESLSFGIRHYISDSIQYFASRLDFFLVTLLLGPGGLGIYSTAVAIAEIAPRLSNEVGNILFAAFASGKVPPSQAAKMFRKVLFLSIFAAAGLFLLAPLLVPALYGNRFLAAVPSLRVLLVGAVAWSTLSITRNRTSALGRPGIGIPILSAATLVDVVLIFALVPRLGVLGASIASTASYCTAALLFWWVFCKTEGCSVRDTLFVRLDDVLDLIKAFWKTPQFIFRKPAAKLSEN